MSNKESRASAKTKPPRPKVREKKDVEEDKVEVLPQLSWRIIDETTTRNLKAITNVDEVAKKFAEVLSLNKHETSLKEAAQLDYFVAGYWFASRESKFSNEQTSAFITILHILLENIKTKHLSLGENLKELQGMMCHVGCVGVRSCLECFTSDIAVTTLLYIQSNLFQHYSLFEYLFTEEQEEEVVTTNNIRLDLSTCCAYTNAYIQLSIEVPSVDHSQTLFPFPLEESISLQLYLKCLDPQSSSPTTTPQPTDEVETLEETLDGLDVPMPDVQEICEEVAPKVEEQLEMSADDIRSMMETMAAAALQSFQSEMMQTMKDKEKVLETKLSKLEKSLNSIS